ncbi:MAG: hypothetical protein JSR82_05645 [Verrucomicrobia bacterium]|nr:hypothetical protein [Verrucomicrobiota bacterium]
MIPPEFRELTTVDELTAYLRLREARWPFPGGLEVNPYDRWSRFLGLFDAEGLQAALRLVVPRSDSPQLPQLRAAVARVRPESLNVLDQAPGWRLTLEEEFGAHGLTRQLDALEAAGVPYCEAGRFVAHPHRPRADTIFRLVPKAASWSVAAVAGRCLPRCGPGTCGPGDTSASRRSPAWGRRWSPTCAFRSSRARPTGARWPSEPAEPEHRMGECRPPQCAGGGGCRRKMPYRGGGRGAGSSLNLPRPFHGSVRRAR